MDPEIRRYLRGVQDHALRVEDQVAGFRGLPQNIRSVNLTLVGLSRNEEVKALSEASIEQYNEIKKISAWAASLFASTLIAGIYGMNFDYMPELNWFLGDPSALALMSVFSCALYFVFKRHGWL